MPKDGTVTKARILDAANELFLERGISQTSIDRIAEVAGVTKGSFFYHFKDKEDLSLQLVSRFAATDRSHYHDTLKKLDSMGVREPRQRVLLFVGSFVEAFSDLDRPQSCLYATYLFEQGLVSDEAMAIAKETFLFWRKGLEQIIKDAAAEHPPSEEIDAASLADLFSTIIEGAFISARILEEPGLVAKQIRHYQTYLEFIFAD